MYSIPFIFICEVIQAYSGLLIKIAITGVENYNTYYSKLKFYLNRATR